MKKLYMLALTMVFATSNVAVQAAWYRYGDREAAPVVRDAAVARPGVGFGRPGLGAPGVGVRPGAPVARDAAMARPGVGFGRPGVDAPVARAAEVGRPGFGAPGVGVRPEAGVGYDRFR